MIVAESEYLKGVPSILPMYDKSLVIELLDEIDEAIRRIKRRFSGITEADDFIRNDDGLDRLDAIGMMLIAGAPTPSGRGS